MPHCQKGFDCGEAVKGEGEQGISSPAVRITPMAGNCAGPHLRLRVDEAKDNDRVFERGGITFVVDQTMLAECGSITADFAESESPCGGCGGFRISGEKKGGGQIESDELI